MKVKERATIEGERKMVVLSGNEQGRTVVVGVKMDAPSKELLTWALVKAAQPGDLVVALHVLPPSSSSSDTKSDSVGNIFNSVLAVYEGFCNLKQIDLKLSICHGSSIRKALIQETQKLSAAKLILGASKSNHLIGISSTSVAKYCAKKLPITCAVLVASNGKIVFQREEASGRRKVQNNSSKDLLLLEASNDNSFCVLSPRKYVQPNGEKKLQFSTTNGASKKSCASDSGAELQKEGSLDLVPVCKKESTSGTIRLLIESLPDARPGWPLLQKAVLQNKRSSIEESEMEVAQWAMHLPSRCSSSAATVDSDHELILKIECLENENEGEIIPVGPDCVHLSDATSEESPKHLKEMESFLYQKYVSTCNLFNFQELADATSNFFDENLIGKGGNSRVYKGILPNGKELAVKILKRSEEALQEFVGEIEIITTLHHRNIINLSGFCFDSDDLLLVYEFLPRGSLEDNLHGLKKNKNMFGWAERYKVAIGVAEALSYLHNCEGNQTVIHRDVKSSNILLCDDFEPKLADFGLATWASSDSTQTICSDVAGTFGSVKKYLAPEYFMFGKVSEKIDIYAFGVVLLELLSGRKPIENEHPKGTHSLVMWAKQILQNGNCKELLDPDLESKDYDEAQAERLILAASLCITRDPRLRPTISTVLKLLHGDDMEVFKWAKLQGNDLESEEGIITCARTNFQSHLNLALLDVEDDILSVCSLDHTVDYIMAHSSLEAYLEGRWSRSSSFE